MKFVIVESVLSAPLPTPADFVMPKNLQRYCQVVNVDVKKFNELWAKDEDYYLAPDNQINRIGNRYEQFIEWMNERKPEEKIEMPNAVVTDRGVASFGNGRHRFAVLRDNGLKVIPIAMDKEENGRWIKNAEKFGVIA
jgi:hypothetical protein